MCLNAVLSTIYVYMRICLCACYRLLIVGDKTNSRKENWAKNEVCTVRASLHLHYDFFSFGLRCSHFFLLFVCVCRCCCHSTILSHHIAKCRHRHGQTIRTLSSIFWWYRMIEMLHERCENNGGKGRSVTHAYNFYDFAVFGARSCWYVKIKYEFVCSMASSKWE